MAKSSVDYGEGKVKLLVRIGTYYMISGHFHVNGPWGSTNVVYKNISIWDSNESKSLYFRN